MEVLARRYNRVLWLHALYVLLGGGLLGGGAYLLRESVAAAVVLFCIGGAVGFFGIFLTVLALKTSAEVIRHDGKSLYFPEFSCSVTDPLKAEFAVPSKESYGTLYVHINGKEFKYRFVADVEQVCKRLKALKQQYQGQ